MSKPRLLDLFSGAGGAAKGYQRAGFYVVGVDHRPMPNYCGDEFVQDDALELMSTFPWWDVAPFDAIHASPPCQAFTAYKRRPDHVRWSPDLIDATRRLLINSGLPHVIENVSGAPLRAALRLCGSSFGLDVRRHRYFECSFPVMTPMCDHSWQMPRFPQATNRENQRSTVEIGVWRIPLEVQQRAMGIDWMTIEELTQAIPPAYTEHIGHYLLAEINARKAAA